MHITAGNLDSVQSDLVQPVWPVIMEAKRVCPDDDSIMPVYDANDIHYGGPGGESSVLGIGQKDKKVPFRAGILQSTHYGCWNLPGLSPL